MLELCSLSSGSSGNTTFLRAQNTSILIDAGNTLKYTVSTLNQIGVNPYEISAVFITHEHSDHIHSAGALSRKFGYKLYMNKNTYMAAKSKLGTVLEENIVLINTGESFDYNGIGVNTVEISHDAAEPVSYSFETSKSKVSIITDLGVVSDAVLKHASGSDILMLEANHDEEMLKASSYPYSLKKRVLSNKGHLSNMNAAKFLIDVMNTGRVSNVMLSHLSGENNLPELAYETFRCSLNEGNIIVDRDIMIDLTYRNKLSKLYRIKK